MSRKPNWFDKHLPSKEELAAHKWLRPWAERIVHPSLWHINRRSVSRGAALGMFFALLTPIGQIFFAALASLYARGNVPIAAATTFVTNPLTLAPVLYCEYAIGSLLLGRPVSWPTLPENEHWFWGAIQTVQYLGLPLVLGIVVLSVIAGIVTYFGIEAVWRWRSTRKWRTRRAQRARA
ncbi:hypothetical protein IP84_11435 [beta proteobacterium AAP99]|nr:hypothetical protein IP84_11435 [beta proteobacterium AAP99]